MTRERKVVFVNRFFFPDESATAQIVADVTAHLCSMGFKVVVVASNARLQASGALPRSETVLGGVEVRRLPHPGGRPRSLFGKLVQLLSFYPLAFAELLRTVSPGDLVVAKTDPPLISTIAWVVTRWRGAQLVNWLQDLYPEVAAKLDTPVVRGPVRNWLKTVRNLSLRRAGANVVIGQTMADVLEAEGVARDRVRIIPNWANEEVLRPVPASASAARKEWGFDRNDFVLGYSGNLGRAHEGETLLAAARLLASRTDIKFLFVGGGHQYARLESAVRRERLTSFVFKPHQPRDRLHDTLGAADAHWLSLRPELEGLIVPSKFYGILAAGRPVVAVSALNGEIGRIVREYECGFAVAPGDAHGLAEAIVALADDLTLRQSMGLRARALCETVFPRASALRSWTDLVASLGIRPTGAAAISATKQGV